MSYSDQNNESYQENTTSGRKVYTEINSGSYAFHETFSPPELNDGKKRIVAIAVAYLGTNYYGSQMNPNTITVEAELERAFFLAGGISTSNFGVLQKIGWSRVSRTDKGVHALSQLISCKLVIDENQPEAFLEKVNRFLPNDIRVYHCFLPTKSFDARIMCECRTYDYLFPSYCLIPLEELEPFFKEIALNNNLKIATAPQANEGGEDSVEEVIALTDEQAYAIQNKIKDFRVSKSQLQLFQTCLARFQGSHCFHNYTSGLDPFHPSAQRFMESLHANVIPIDEQTEWVSTKIIGQSFLLHQIRKMIGTSILVTQGILEIETIPRSFQSCKMYLPKAPANGLFLSDLNYNFYNFRQGQKKVN